MSVKIALAAIAVVAIGIFALPSTISVFGGLHTWYYLDARSGKYMPCIKCHADVYEEYAIMARTHAPHWTLEGYDPNKACYSCHRVKKQIQYAEGGSPMPGKQAHAASTIACLECHEFDITNNDVHDKHRDYVQAAKDYPLMESSNEACIACHTDIEMHIEWTDGG
jgi:hypothetical protein